MEHKAQFETVIRYSDNMPIDFVINQAFSKMAVPDGDFANWLREIGAIGDGDIFSGEVEFDIRTSFRKVREVLSKTNVLYTTFDVVATTD